MATNKKHQNQKSKTAAAKKQTQNSASAAWYRTKLHLWMIAAILAVTVVCYLHALGSGKEFTNWDDPMYVTEQPLTRAFNADTLEKIFEPSTQVALNYHPLTMLSLEINYNISGMNPVPFVFTNILFHLANTLLVFLFLYKLSRNKFWIGALPALWFAIHPMHVESVAWIAERKDVLYTFFFLLSCLKYLDFIEKRKTKYLVYTFAFFVCSMLSKAMAAPLPFVLLLVDYFRERKITWRVVAEKIPFLIVSLLLGYNAVHIQSNGAIADYNVFSTMQRFMFACYGFNMYLVKLFFPFGLSAFYPYPALDNGHLPLIYTLSPIITLAIVSGFLLLVFKFRRKMFPTVVFGLGFFSLMIALVLQFISVGAAIMADRYSYIPYIGIFFIIASFLDPYFENVKKRILAITAVAAGSLFFALLCYNRVPVWDTSETLWTDVIKKYPYEISQEGNVIHVTKVGVDVAYKNRGNYYREHNMMDKAKQDYLVLVRADAKDAGVYSNMGNMYALNKDYANALVMYSKSLSLNASLFDSYYNRAITYAAMGDHAHAIGDFRSAMNVDKGRMDMLYNIASEQLTAKDYAACILTCNQFLAQVSTHPGALLVRGSAYVNTGQYALAVADLSKSVAVDPKNASAWYNLSIAYKLSGNFPAAHDAALQAKAHGFNVSDQYLQQLANGK